MYNRVPKTGSTTVQHIIRELSGPVRNHFNYVQSKIYGERDINLTQQVDIYIFPFCRILLHIRNLKLPSYLVHVLPLKLVTVNLVDFTCYL